MLFSVLTLCAAITYKAFHVYLAPIFRICIYIYGKSNTQKEKSMTALLSLLVMVIAIYILSLVTDEFFIKSLDQISARWKLPSNVAGASLMAAGSSAPELSIAILSLFKEGGAHSDVGVGTIVGSAIFNILIITGVSAIVREAKVTIPTIVRDTVFYLISIILLMAVFWDGKIEVQECLVFIFVYGIYIAFLLFSPPEVEPEIEEQAEKTGEGFFGKMNAMINSMTAVLAGDAKKSYIRAFGVSIVFIVALSWILVDAAVIFANAVGIPPVIVALTILAAGTSAPDLIASVVVAKQGRGSMAVANAIGSNIFDILICLGLPWLIALLFLGKQVIEVGTGDLIGSVLILVATVVIVFVFLYTDRLLTKKEGWGLVGLYAVYVVWTVMFG